MEVGLKEMKLYVYDISGASDKLTLGKTTIVMILTTIVQDGV